MLRQVLYLGLLIISSLVAPCYAQAPVLLVDGGRISGITVAKGIALYKGIPYAAAPVGERRWKKPQPVEPWEGVRKCDTWGAASLQGGSAKGSFYWKEFYQGGDPHMSEDCLYLNVWTPAAGKSKEKLPVMVWIHGGAYMNGYGYETEFDGEAYARQGVILVTFNYRLGMCGFLAHPLLSAENGGKGSGNYGLYDQLQVLRWVKNNIAVFGGDASNVTLFGQSAGAGSVQALVSSPLSKGLISKAIIQSGGGLGGIISAMPSKIAEERGKMMWEHTDAKTLKDMRSYPADKFQQLLMDYMKRQTTWTGLPFGPCVDGELITDAFDATAKRGGALDIPYMIGYTSEDINPKLMREAALHWSQLQEKQHNHPAYVYCFGRDLPGEDMENAQGGFGDMKGAFHSSELWYMFGTLKRCWRPMEPHDYGLSQKMVAYWTNFAKTGNPNGDKLPLWKPCTKDEENIMILK